MVNLARQYQRLQPELDEAIRSVLATGQYIKGKEVTNFEQELARLVGYQEVVSCGNGTDALQIALRTLGLQQGDEVIVPSFSYFASAEAIAFLGLEPRFVEVDEDTFCLDPEAVADAITPKTRAILPVHLFGQAAPMRELLELARQFHLFIIEDNAQSIGCIYRFEDGTAIPTGAMGDVGCLSFFPSKNLGGYGDGGAMTFGVERDKQSGGSHERALVARRIANHGQEKRYQHLEIGCNSRLDTLQAAILLVKLRYLTQMTARRREVATLYDQLLAGINAIKPPFRSPTSQHVFHQYTLQVLDGRRDALQHFLKERGIASAVYYPMPIHCQPAFKDFVPKPKSLRKSEQLCQRVLSLPICSEITNEEVLQVGEIIRDFFQK